MIVSERQPVSLHTYTGVQLYQFRPEDKLSLSWGRELRNTSRCELVAPVTSDINPQDVVPWLHWLSVWDESGQSLLWSGPIVKAASNRRTLQISAQDVSGFTAKTRNPLTKAWDAADPSVIAGELWAAMIELHGLETNPILRVDPECDAFDYRVVADEAMLDGTIKDLVRLGLRWTVVAGTPILGPAGRQPVASLGENDFLGDGLSLIRDGSGTFNDVLLRGGDALSRAKVDLAGLNLQTIVNVDDMFGVSNTDRAVYQYARHTAGIRDAITLDQGTDLHPDAPVSIDELVPSARFVVTAYDTQFLMELDAVSVSSEPGRSSVQVALESVIDLPELAELQQKGRAQ